MAETDKKTTVKKHLKKKLFRLGLSQAKPLLLWGAFLLVADGCALAALMRTASDGGFLPVLFWILCTALTTAILLLITGVIYQLSSVKARAALHLLDDVKGALHSHVQERQQREFRRAVRLTLDNIAKDTEQQKELLDRLQALNLPAAEQDDSLAANKESRLERLTRLLNQSVDALVYLEQIYEHLQAFSAAGENKNNDENGNDGI